MFPASAGIFFCSSANIKKPRAINSGLLPCQASMQTLNIICGRVAWTSIWAAQFAFAPSIHKMYYFDFAIAMI